MPQNLTPVSAFTSPVVAPVDGDPRNAASVNGALQALTNRTEFSKNALDFWLAQGVQRIEPIASVAALKAVTGMTDNQVALVLAPSNIILGLYIYKAGSSATGDDVMVITPTSGIGRWKSLLAGFTTGSGVTSRWAFAVPNAIVSITDTTDTGDVSTPMTGAPDWYDVGLTSNPVTVAVGDKVKIESVAVCANDTALSVQARLAAHDGATATEIAGTAMQLFPGAVDQQVWTTLLGYHVPSVAGTYTYRVQGLGTNGSNFKISGNRRILVTVVRPLWRSGTTAKNGGALVRSILAPCSGRRPCSHADNHLWILRAADDPRLGRGRLTSPVAGRALPVRCAGLPHRARLARHLIPAAIGRRRTATRRAGLLLGERHAAPAARAALGRAARSGLARSRRPARASRPRSARTARGALASRPPEVEALLAPFAIPDPDTRTRQPDLRAGRRRASCPR